MTIESIKRSLSATELNQINKEATRHTNIVAFVIKVFFENKCSINAVREALNARKEDRLDQLYFISLKLISTYSSGMEIPPTGLPIYANAMEHVLLNVMKNEDGQNELVLWDFSKDTEVKTVLRVIDDELINTWKQLVENNDHIYNLDIEHAKRTVRIMNAAKLTYSKILSSNRQEFVNFIEKEMIDKYGVFFWEYITDLVIKEDGLNAKRREMYKNNCIVA